MRNNIPSLNGLRAVSIFIVIFSHLKQRHFLPDNSLKYAKMLFFDGRFAVNIFFFISGYLITTLLEAELKRTGSISIKNFYLRRTLRIFPAYYFLLLVYAILQWNNFFYIDRISWILSLSYLKQFYLGPPIELGHLWSLSVEEFFYLIWPFLFIRFYKRSTGIAMILIVCAVIARMAFYDYPYAGLQQTIFTAADALLIGCLFAMHQEKVKQAVLKKYISVLLLMVGIVACIAINYYCYHLMTIQREAGGYSKTMFLLSAFVYGVFGNIGFLTNLLVGMLVIRSVYHKGAWFKFLNTRIMDFMGKLSYSIYLWQQMFISDNPFWHKFSIPVLLAFVFVASIISYYGIERPFLILKKRFASEQR